jgi:hypothetical protein
MKLLIIILLLSLKASGQLGTVHTDSVYFNIKTYGPAQGSFRFDYSTGKFTRSGSQVECFRTLFRVYHEMNERLMLAFDVIRHVDSTGCIKDPAGFINALKEWYR